MDDLAAGWPSRRAFHRQMYIDLVRSHLLRFGSQRELARSLGVSDAFLSVLLEPVRPAGGSRRGSYWGEVTGRPSHDIAEELRERKTPSQRRAEQLVDRLCTDRERRDLLLHHIDQARRPRRPAEQPARTVPPEEIVRMRDALSALHDVALRTPDPNRARTTYAQVWDAASDAVRLIDGRRYPLELVAVLMVRHDAACVLNRADLALSCARQAVLLLDQSLPRPSGARHHHVRLRVNAALAEIVALNNLGLHREALTASDHAQSLPGYDAEPEQWMRSFMEQRLRSIRRSVRGSIYDAERTADRALGFVSGNLVLSAGIESYLVDVYLVDRSPRSRRRAARLVDGLIPVALGEADVSPLRRTRLLRTAARHLASEGDQLLRDELTRRCQTIIETAGLTHRRAELDDHLAQMAT